MLCNTFFISECPQHKHSISNSVVSMQALLRNFVGILFPNTCLICNENLMQGESQICLHCFNNIPRTNFHKVKDNEVEKRFWGKADIYKATAFFYYSKGSSFQQLLHELKYKGNYEIGVVAGKFAAIDLLENGYFNDVDLLIPIPLHRKKFLKRGYNQSEKIALGMGELLEKPVDTRLLQRMKNTDTQTKKSVFERYENTSGVFELLNSDSLGNKHVLLVDDVLTTGSTIEAAVLAFGQCKNIKISVFTLAMA